MGRGLKLNSGFARTKVAAAAKYSQHADFAVEQSELILGPTTTLSTLRADRIAPQLLAGEPGSRTNADGWFQNSHHR